jgi:hypothetical protein
VERVLPVRSHRRPPHHLHPAAFTSISISSAASYSWYSIAANE